MADSDIQDASQSALQQNPLHNHFQPPNTATLEADTNAAVPLVAAHDKAETTAQADGFFDSLIADGSAPESDAVEDVSDAASPLDVANASEGNGTTEVKDGDIASEIDQRRAKQLLDRAILLSERGDLAGAILASRQAVALAPSEPAGHSMLGLLHERAGDLEKAINSYEKVLQLAPSSTLERDSLDRLKSTLESENSSVVFHFDDNDLFEEPEAIAPLSTEAPPSQTSSKAGLAAVAAATSAATPVTTAPSPALVANAKGVTASEPAAVHINAEVAPIRSENTLPQALSAAAKPASLRPAMNPLTMPATAQRPSLALLMRRPSFYFKGAPIVAATTLGLLFMAWAEGVSQNKFLEESIPGSASNSTVQTTPDVSQTAPVNNTAETTGGSVSPAVPAPQGAGTTGGGIFGNGKVGAPVTPTTSVAVPAAPSARSGNSAAVSSGLGAAQSVGSSGVTTLPPAPVRNPVIPQPGGVIGGVSGSNGGTNVNSGTLNSLPSMRPRNTASEVVRPSASAPVTTQGTNGSAATEDRGSTASGSSAQGGMFNPANSPRGYIRIDPVRPANPVTPMARPGNEARAAENAASRAAAAGRTNDVVPSLNRAIERQATGYSYQRRAMAWMEQGDYSRAADDFQSAIAAYQDQIRQNQNVEDARNGIQTSRSGLNLALSKIGR